MLIVEHGIYILVLQCAKITGLVRGCPVWPYELHLAET